MVQRKVTHDKCVIERGRSERSDKTLKTPPHEVATSEEKQRKS